MAKNRIREIRKLHGLTVAQLADKTGISQPQLTRIEGAKRGLSIAVAERIAMALGVSPEEVLGLTKPAEPSAGLGFSEDLELYEPGPTDLPTPRQKLNVDPWRVKTSSLDRLGINPGDIVFVDVSAETVDNLQPLALVVVQIYDPDPNVMRAVTVMRQFVPPSLLITNSSGTNARSLDLERDEVAIKGVIIGSQRSFRA